LDGIRAIHRRVHGELRAATGIYPAGTPYSAEDPDLVLPRLRSTSAPASATCRAIRCATPHRLVAGSSMTVMRKRGLVPEDRGAERRRSSA
jgi:hypothetical protein